MQELVNGPTNLPGSECHKETARILIRYPTSALMLDKHLGPPMRSKEGWSTQMPSYRGRKGGVHLVPDCIVTSPCLMITIFKRDNGILETIFRRILAAPGQVLSCITFHRQRRPDDTGEIT